MRPSCASAPRPMSTAVAFARSRRCPATPARTRSRSSSTIPWRSCSPVRPQASGWRRDPDMSRLSVLLTTEGTYPFHRGGVSTWCHALTSQLAEVDFRLLAVTMHPYLTPKYRVPGNVREVITGPLWGTEDPAEYGRHRSFPNYLRKRWATTRREIEREIVVPYESLIREIVTPVLPWGAAATVLLEL